MCCRNLALLVRSMAAKEVGYMVIAREEQGLKEANSSRKHSSLVARAQQPLRGEGSDCKCPPALAEEAKDALLAVVAAHVV